MSVDASSLLDVAMNVLRDAGWGVGDTSVDRLSPDDYSAGLGRGYVLRLAEQPVLGVTVPDGDPTSISRETLSGWGANLAYNRRIPMSLVLMSDKATLFATSSFMPASVPSEWGLNSDSPQRDSVAVFPVASAALSSRTEVARLVEHLVPTRLTSDKLKQDTAEAARASGYSVRTTVDEVLLEHLYHIRAELVRGDSLDRVDADKRNELDLTVVSLMTRLLFIRHLEDHGHSGWLRGTLLQLVADQDAESSLEGAFARLDG